MATKGKKTSAKTKAASKKASSSAKKNTPKNNKKMTTRKKTTSKSKPIRSSQKSKAKVSLKSKSVARKSTAKKSIASKAKRVAPKPKKSARASSTKVKTAKVIPIRQTKRPAVRATAPAANKPAASKMARVSPTKSSASHAPASGNKIVMLKTKKVPSGTASNLGTMGVPPYQEKRGEEYMNDEQMLHFRKILNLWKQELMEEVDRTVHHMQDEASNFPDPNDRATQEEEFSLELRTRDRERKLIKKIEEALQKIESEDYGYCDSCGIEIGIRRLEARPTANLCIDCKTLDEIKERQTGG